MNKHTKETLTAVSVMLNTSQDLCVMPEYLTATKGKVQAYLTDYQDGDEDETGNGSVGAPEISYGTNAVSIISVSGMLVKAGDIDQETEEECGICNIDRVTAELKDAAQDENVTMVCMVFDTCGGEVIGIRELADLVSTIADTKLVIGYCSTMCLSAGYWVASQCGMFAVSDSSKIGMVGCYVERLDLTKQMEMEGIKVNVIADNVEKTWRHPATVMSAEEEAYLSANVVKIGDEFRSAVLRHREIDPQYLKGRIFLGEDAADTNLNLADVTVSDLDDLLSFFSGGNYL